MLLISYGVCAAYKRPDVDAAATTAPLSTDDVFEMLLWCMRTVNPERRWPELVAITGLVGDVPAKIVERATIRSRPDNPGHQQGAAWNIAESLRFARAGEHRFLFHCGGDVIPESPTAVADELRLLEHSRADYIAGRWGANEDGVGTQCFLCRTAAFFDAAGNCLVFPASASPTLELYMGALLRRRELVLCPHAMSYVHTHDLARFRAEAQRFLKQIERTP